MTAIISDSTTTDGLQYIQSETRFLHFFSVENCVGLCEMCGVGGCQGVAMRLLRCSEWNLASC